MFFLGGGYYSNNNAIDLYFGQKSFFYYQILKKMSSAVAISLDKKEVAQVSRNGLSASHNGCRLIYKNRRKIVGM